MRIQTFEIELKLQMEYRMMHFIVLSDSIQQTIIVVPLNRGKAIRINHYKSMSISLNLKIINFKGILERNCYQL